MRLLFAISMLVLAAAAVGAAQESPAPQPPVSQEKLNQERGTVDPQKQCEWIGKEKPELAPVQKACEAAVAGFETLPNFVCDLKMTRKEPLQRPEKITAELRYYEGEEELRDVTINGQATEKMPDTGIWSRGEFAPPGLSVLDGRSSPQFSFQGEKKSGSTTMMVFDYRIAKAANKAWTWSIPPYQYRPGFHGELRIDKESGLLRSVSLVADDIDSYVPTLSASVSMDYAPVRIGDLGEYLLPSHSEVKSCGRFDRRCSEIVRDFVNCRKFAGKARIVE
jgi:hypothetical protein